MSSPGTHIPVFEEGDIFYTQYSDKYYLYKLLRKDEAQGAYHVLSYVPVTELPGIDTIGALTVNVYHLPMHQESFAGAKFLSNETVSDDELIGFYEYISQQEKDFEEAAAKATEYYQEAYLLTDEGRLEAAIETYTKAIDLVPFFFEAIDNRAFCKMDLGQWSDAITDFNLSLQVNPDSLLAEFSIGECYYRLGHFAKARDQFEKCLKLDPTHQVSKDFLLKTTEIIAQHRH